MSQKVPKHIDELDSMKRYPKELFFRGNLDLLDRFKISIVGTRRPSSYTRSITLELSSKLSRAGVCIVSGAAMGVDAIAHSGASSSNTIAVLGNGLDIRYPATNRTLLESIEQDGLLLSPFEDGFRATNWSFVVRNEIVVALSDLLIVTQADLGSGSLRSVEYALKMQKKIFVIPHRLHESRGTNDLLAQAKANLILDVDQFVETYAQTSRCIDDPFLQFCLNSPTYEEAVRVYPQEVFSYELDGKIEVVAGRIRVC